MATLLAPGLVVAAFSVDEWYGFTAEFHWTDAGKARHAAVLKAKRDLDLRGLRGREWQNAHVATDRLEITLAREIAAEVLASPEAAEFFSKPHKVEVEEHGGGRPNGLRTIPRFTPTDFSDWDFWADGGSISASDRD